MASFINLKLFPTLVEHLELPGIFWMHAGILLFACILAFFIVPETQGKTLTELTNLYNEDSPRMTTKRKTELH